MNFAFYFSLIQTVQQNKESEVFPQPKTLSKASQVSGYVPLLIFIGFLRKGKKTQLQYPVDISNSHCPLTVFQELLQNRSVLEEGGVAVNALLLYSPSYCWF